MARLKKPKKIECEYGGDYYVIPPFSFHKIKTPNNRHVWHIFVNRPDGKFGHKVLGQYYVETGGFFVLEVSPNIGYLDEYDLKSLHDFLVFLNAPYDKEIDRYFRWEWLREVKRKLRNLAGKYGIKKGNNGNNTSTTGDSQEGCGAGVPAVERTQPS